MCIDFHSRSMAYAEVEKVRVTFAADLQGQCRSAQVFPLSAQPKNG